jgi:hypothetical protein
MGFSLIVNDVDQGHDRAALRFGEGISSPQDPTRFAAKKVDTNTVEAYTISNGPSRAEHLQNLIVAILSRPCARPIS